MECSTKSISCVSVSRARHGSQWSPPGVWKLPSGLERGSVQGGSYFFMDETRARWVKPGWPESLNVNVYILQDSVGDQSPVAMHLGDGQNVLTGSIEADLTM